MNYTLCCMWLVMAFGVGNPKIWDIIKRFGNPQNAYASLKSEHFDFLSPKEIKAISTSHIEQCLYVCKNCEVKNIKIVCYYDEDYPVMLENISNPPIILFVKGDMNILNKLCITVVGTRNPSQYSMRTASRICSELVKFGIVIVSGFALGIDSVCHNTAMTCGGKTVAVLGCGIDVDYPRENASLRVNFEEKGLMITEFFPGTRPSAPNFPKRNRILSGLSSGTFIVEGSRTSGAVITAEFAVEQGRDLFCLPPADIFDDRYSGVVDFLREGAIPVFSYIDIIYEYYTVFTHKISAKLKYTEKAVSLRESSVFESEKNENKKITEKTEKYIDKPEIKKHSEKNFSEEYISIINILRNGSKYVDELSAELKVSVSELYLTLTDMEIEGIIECLPGKIYKLV